MSYAELVSKVDQIDRNENNFGKPFKSAILIQEMGCISLFEIFRQGKAHTFLAQLTGK